MSSVPLMKLHYSNRSSGDARDSDQMSDDDDDPLESVLARMKYRPQHRSRDFYSAMILTGILCLIIGFLASYITYISTGKSKNMYLNDNHEVDPQMAKYFLQNINPSNVDNILSDLINPSNRSIPFNEYEAHLLVKHFTQLGFDSVSIKPSTVLLSYYDWNRPNKVSIVDNKKSEVEKFYNNESAYYKTPDGLHVSNIVEDTVVYINFGQDSDYEYLKRMEIFVKGCIVLARLGRVSPVTLVDNALKRGARGVVLFADPQQYPHADNSNYPFLWPYQLGLLQVLHGNPETNTSKNENEKEQARRCVPVQMIKPHDAQQILLKMSSNNQSYKSWLGGLKLTTYPMGPGFSTQDYQLRLEVNAVNIEEEIFSVTAAIRGDMEPDRYVLLGSDSQLLASRNDYSSEGIANMMELAHGLSKLKTAKNWKPRRTIVFCSWGVPQANGHIHGTPLNSSEWPNLLNSRAVAYISLDVAAKEGNGRFSARGTPLLSQLMYDASLSVPYDSSKASVFDVWLQETVNTSTLKYPTMGSVIPEEDLQTLLYNQGIPSLHFQFTHSEMVDNVKWLRNTDMHQRTVQLWGILALKLADSIILPFNVQEYAAFLNRSVVGIQTKYENVVSNQSLPLGLLHNVVKNFSEAAETFQEKLIHANKMNAIQARILNDQLMQLEGAFVHHSSSKKIRHAVLSPGASINNDMSLGFGSLQDLLSEISSSPIAADLRHNVSDHILSLVHCVKSAITVLGDPLIPLTFNN